MFSNNPRSNRLYWDAAFALLGEAPTKLKKLERVKFAICLSGEAKLLAHQLGDIDWKQLETLLCQVPQLRSVEFSIEHRGASSNGDAIAWKTISEKLPALAAKGCLRRVTK